MFENKLIFRKLRQGDKRVFDLVFDQYKSGLFTTALLMLEDQDQASQTVSEVFISLAKSAALLKPKTSIRDFLYISLFDDIREKIKNEKFSIKQALRPTKEKKQYSLSLDKQTEQLLAAVEELGPNLKTVLAMRLFGQFSFWHISNLQNISQAIAKSRYDNALTQIEDSLSKMVSYQ